MKNLSYTLALFLFVLIFNITDIKAQCNAGSFAEKSISKIDDGYTFLKSYKIDGQGGGLDKVEQSYVFSKDATYQLNITADGNETDGIIVSIYDSNRSLKMTSFANGKFYNKVEYPCNATGIYYITFTFKDSKNHCGGAALGFKR
ncbi:MAG: hypothetical protein LAT68_12365 [Cyclobacteriaceae bacterium]|nr:hypothetical protein [Cyclobacteriaceae bacterium]MCH8517111.1 hypothetical protein [Cyclobacteriaceae bacterium]